MLLPSLLLFLCALSLIYSALVRFISRYDQVDLGGSHLGKECFPKRFDRAVVLGGSIAGLAAASVLSKHANRVVILERHKFEPTRSVVKQADQLHVLLERGSLIWEKMFPGLRRRPLSLARTVEELKEAGSVEVDWGEDFNWWGPGGKKRKFGRGHFRTLFSMRDLYEPILRNRVLSLPNVEVMDECVATDLVASGNQIRGVKVRHRGEEGQIEAELVADCCGMSDMSPIWLKRAGFSVPLTEVTVNLAYSSLVLEFERELPPGLFYHQAYPPRTRGATAFPISQHEMLMTAFTVSKEPHPTTVEEFRAFCADFPAIRDLLEEGSPKRDLKVFKKESNLFRHYERVQLDGFVALGEAVCSFNPVYGSGQSTASEAALLLDTVLREAGPKASTGDLCKEFQRRLSLQLTALWLFIVSTDLEFPLSSGGTASMRLFQPLLHLFVDRLHRVAAVDEEVSRVLYSAVHMRQGYLWSLLSWKTLWRLLKPRGSWADSVSGESE